jgi:hypothetical protein
MSGVSLIKIDVTDATAGAVTLDVQLTIMAESELDAIGWLVGVLEEER